VCLLCGDASTSGDSMCGRLRAVLVVLAATWQRQAALTGSGMGRLRRMCSEDEVYF
jgi:hypothetical protein